MLRDLADELEGLPALAAIILSMRSTSGGRYVPGGAPVAWLAP